MAYRFALGIVLASMLVACGPQAKVEPPAEKAAETATPPAPLGKIPAEELDPFVVMIGAERWTVILDKALEGAREAPDGPGAVGETDLYRADAATKTGAAMVIELRNRVCRKGLVTGDACKLPEWPAWTLEPPTGDTPIEEIDRRSGWLDTVMAPLTEAGCAAGRAALKDEMFCSVE